jgi:hypothetical protein
LRRGWQALQKTIVNPNGKIPGRLPERSAGSSTSGKSRRHDRGIEARRRKQRGIFDRNEFCLF